MEDMEYLVPSKLSKLERNTYFYVSCSEGRMTIGERDLVRRDLIDRRETIGGEMCRTKITLTSTLLIVDDDSHMIVLDT